MPRSFESLVKDKFLSERTKDIQVRLNFPDRYEEWLTKWASPEWRGEKQRIPPLPKLPEELPLAKGPFTSLAPGATQTLTIPSPPKVPPAPQAVLSHHAARRAVLEEERFLGGRAPLLYAASSRLVRCLRAGAAVESHSPSCH